MRVGVPGARADALNRDAEAVSACRPRAWGGVPRPDSDSSPARLCGRAQALVSVRGRGTAGGASACGQRGGVPRSSGEARARGQEQRHGAAGGRRRIRREGPVCRRRRRRGARRDGWAGAKRKDGPEEGEVWAGLGCGKEGRGKKGLGCAKRKKERGDGFCIFFCKRSKQVQFKFKFKRT